MPMTDYKTVVINNFVTDIVGEIQTFATDNGWTVTGDEISDGAGLDVDITISSDPATTDWLRAITTGMAFATHIANKTILGTAFSGSGVLHCFAHEDPKILTFGYNYATDMYQWLTFGRMVKYGGWTGGEFVCGSHKFPVSQDVSAAVHPSGVTFPTPGAPMIACRAGQANNLGRDNGSWFRLEIDDAGAADGWVNTAPDAPSNAFPRVFPWYTTTDRLGLIPIAMRKPNAWNQQSVLVPLVMSCTRESSQVSCLGHVPGVRVVRLDNFQREELVTVGEQTFKVFPWLRRADNDLFSGFWGYAFELPEGS